MSKTPKAKRFAWQSPAWKELDLKTCYLQEKYRQNDDKLITVLDEIRAGEVSEKSHKLFESRYQKELKSAFTPTKLYTHNIDVDRINHEELDKLEEEEKVFVYASKGSQNNVEKIFKSSLVLERLALKKGAVVIFIKNSAEGSYVNGTTGVVLGFSPIDNMPIVRTAEGRKIKLDLEEWSLENEAGSVVATISQVPLRLAWAMTIHKSQGMTLDAAEIDLSKTFERGQGYVALSRIKNIEGLRLMGINEIALQVDPLILHIDDRIKMASQRAAQEIETLSQRQLEEHFEAHIEKLGGITNRIKIEENRDNIKSGKVALSTYKTATHIKTKHLIEKCSTLIELAKKRGSVKRRF